MARLLDPMLRTATYAARRMQRHERRTALRRDPGRGPYDDASNQGEDDAGLAEVTDIELVDEIPEAVDESVGRISLVQSDGFDDSPVIGITRADGTVDWVNLATIGRQSDSYEYVGQWGLPAGSALGKFLSPQGIDVSTGGTSVYVPDASTNNRVTRFNAIGGVLATSSGVFAAFPADIPVDVYFADNTSELLVLTYNGSTFAGKIYRLNSTTLALVASATLPAGSAAGSVNFPVSIALNTVANRVYVVDQNNNRVNVYSYTALAYVGTFGAAGSGDGQLAFPHGVANNLAGTLIYVTDTNNHRVQVFDATTFAYVSQWGEFGSAPGQFQYPRGIAVDGLGQIYVADSGNRRVQVFDSTGALVATIGGTYGYTPGAFVLPWDVAVSPSGVVYVVDYGAQRVQFFRAIDIAYQPVPSNITLLSSIPGVAGTNYEWTNQGSGIRELFDNANNRTIADLTYTQQARLYVDINQTGAAGATLEIQYFDDTSATWLSLCSPSPTVPLNTATETVSAWGDIVADARRPEVKMRVVGNGGNGTADPRFRSIAIQLR